MSYDPITGLPAVITGEAIMYAGIIFIAAWFAGFLKPLVKLCVVIALLFVLAYFSAHVRGAEVMQ